MRLRKDRLPLRVRVAKAKKVPLPQWPLAAATVELLDLKLHFVIHGTLVLDDRWPALHLFVLVLAPRVMLHDLTRVSVRSTLSFTRPLIQRKLYATGKPQQSTHRPGGQDDPIKFWPLFAIFVLGSGTYALMVKRRAALPQQEISGETRKTGRYQRNA